LPAREAEDVQLPCDPLSNKTDTKMFRCTVAPNFDRLRVAASLHATLRLDLDGGIEKTLTDSRALQSCLRQPKGVAG